MTVRARCAAALLCALAAGCGGEDEQAPAESAETRTVAAAPRVVPLSDAEALGVLSAISAAGAESARAPVALIETAEVRRFLNVVRADHEALQAELNAIADSLQITPAPHAAADRVRAAAQDVVTGTAQLQYGADGPVVTQQGKLQNALLAVLDSTLLPGTRQELLLQYARAMRPTVAAHGQRVTQLEALLKERARQRAERPVTPAAPVVPRPQRVDTLPPPPPDTGVVR